MRKFSSWHWLLSVALCLCMALSLVLCIPVTASAAGTEGMITIELSDLYGDGWSDNAIEIYADGELLDTATMDDGESATWTTTMDPHTAYEFRWVSGIYAQETSFVIYVGTEEKVSASGYDYVDGATILSLEKTCSGSDYVNGVCADCGAPCPHRYIGKDGNCAACGYTCSGHSWSGGVCSVCSGTCLHQAYEAGTCSVCGSKMIMSIEMQDVYSDGWTGNAINIYADGVLLDTVTIDGGFTGFWSTEYVTTATYTFEWVAGNYADECSFRILLVDKVCFEATAADCGALDNGVFYTMEPWCDHAAYDENYCCTSCGKPCPHTGIEPKGTCGTCGFTCGTSAKHAWDNDTCTVCGLVCAHEGWDDFVCDHCGLACGTDAAHSFDDAHTCTICGFTCGTSAKHAWDKGTCTVCGLGCAHDNWTNSICDNCGLACGTDAAHSFDDAHTCTICGFICGTSAEHVWDQGTCTVCGVSCEHPEYANGVCPVCGDYQPAVQNGVGENGFALYEIHNAGQLLWFADYVNSNEVLSTKTIQDSDTGDAFYFEYTTGCVNGKLMADIDMSGLSWTPICAPYISPYSTSRNSYGYAGVFDGNGHTVSGIDCTVVSDDNTVYAGFFGALGGGTVKNLTVKGNIQGIANTVYYPAAYVGGIAGYACEWYDYPGTSTESRQDVYSIIENCTFIGTVSVKAKDQEYVGGIAGIASGTSITNCFSAATVSATGEGYSSVGSLCGYIMNECTLTNCWYDSTLCAKGEVNGEDHDGVTGMSTELLALGSAAHALGFGQTLGVDAYPSYGDDPVYQVTTGCCTYSNTQPEAVTEKAHTGGIACTEKPVCADCGLSYGEVLGHIADEDDGDCTTDVLCATCGTVVTAGNAEHSWADATCTAPKTCSICGTTEGAALGHSYNAVTTDATCTAAGKTVYTCGNCGDSYSESIPANGHTEETIVGKAPTCTDTGLTDGVVCTVCGETVTAQEVIPVADHSYVDGVCTVCGGADPDYVKPVVVPTLGLVGPTLNFEDEIYYNIYYTVSDLTNVVEMGLITFNERLADGTINDAEEVIPGYTKSGDNYMSHTNGIPAKMLGDALFFRVYAKLSDGSYVYSQVAGYHAVAYAKDILANSTSEKMKALVVAMLNYGAAAQTHFEYKTDSLMNAFLTAEQQALVSEYSADMVNGLVSVDASKVGSFTRISNSYTALAPNVSFEGAFSINYYFTPAKDMDGEMKLYYWTLDDYNAVDVLTTENATGVIVMEETSVAGQYFGAVSGIAAKQIDETIFVCGVYECDGVSYPTGILTYSLGAYCQDRIAKGTATMQEFAKATAVYGYYAKAYFA